MILFQDIYQGGDGDGDEKRDKDNQKYAGDIPKKDDSQKNRQGGGVTLEGDVDCDSIGFHKGSAGLILPPHLDHTK